MPAESRGIGPDRLDLIGLTGRSTIGHDHDDDGNRARVQPRGNPVWRKAPASLLRHPTLFAALALGAFLVVISTAAYPLFLSASGSALVTSEIDNPTVTRFGAGITYTVTNVRLAEAEPRRRGPPDRPAPAALRADDGRESGDRARGRTGHGRRGHGHPTRWGEPRLRSDERRAVRRHRCAQPCGHRGGNGRSGRLAARLRRGPVGRRSRRSDRAPSG